MVLPSFWISQTEDRYIIRLIKRGKSRVEQWRGGLIGQAPRGVIRVDKGNTNTKEQSHVHFGDKAALNQDGTWKEGYIRLTNDQKAWLQKNGWRIPND